MTITYATLNAAVELAIDLNLERECVHIHADGTLSAGTDGRSTTPSDGWGDVIALFHPWLDLEPWDCLRDPAEGVRGALTPPDEDDEDDD